MTCQPQPDLAFINGQHLSWTGEKWSRSASWVSMKNFFISYNQHDKHWAEWIAWTLEESGYTVIVEVWDFRPGGNFVQYMDWAVKGAKQTIAVLSQHFLDANYTQSEWSAAFAEDPQGLQRTLIPVRVGEYELKKGLLKQLVYVDLVGVTEAEAQKRLLDGLKARAKPDQKPSFPNAVIPTAERTQPEPVAFPGTATTIESAVGSGSKLQQQVIRILGLLLFVFTSFKEIFVELISFIGSSLIKIIKILEWLIEKRIRIQILIVLMIIVFVTRFAIDEKFETDKCINDIHNLQTITNQPLNKREMQNKYFELGIRIYECRKYPSIFQGAKPSYKSWFDRAAEELQDENSYNIFVAKVKNLRENPSSLDDFDLAITLLEEAERIEPDWILTKVELGNTEQARFDFITKTDSSFSDDSIARAQKSITDAMNAYSEVAPKDFNLVGVYSPSPCDENVELTSLIRLSYAKILYGDFLLKYGTPPQPQRVPTEESRKELAEAQYNDSIGKLQYISNHISGKLMNDALLGISITQLRLGPIKINNVETSHSLACQAFKEISTREGCIDNGELYNKWSEQAPSHCL